MNIFHFEVNGNDTDSSSNKLDLFPSTELDLPFMLESISLLDNITLFHGNMDINLIPYMILDEKKSYVNPTDIQFIKLPDNDYSDFIPMYDKQLLLFTKKGRYCIIDAIMNREASQNLNPLQLKLKNSEFILQAKTTEDYDYLVVNTVYKPKDSDFDEEEIEGYI